MGRDIVQFTKQSMTIFLMMILKIEIDRGGLVLENMTFQFCLYTYKFSVIGGGGASRGGA